MGQSIKRCHLKLKENFTPFLLTPGCYVFQPINIALKICSGSLKEHFLVFRQALSLQFTMDIWNCVTLHLFWCRLAAMFYHQSIWLEPFLLRGLPNNFQIQPVLLDNNFLQYTYKENKLNQLLAMFFHRSEYFEQSWKMYTSTPQLRPTDYLGVKKCA